LISTSTEALADPKTGNGLIVFLDQTVDPFIVSLESVNMALVFINSCMKIH
jgi:hypothetical protein